MDLPFFSVVIPLYNTGKYIEVTVRSVIGQTYKNFEVVIVDDGSTDDGPEKVGLVGDSRIRLIRKENGGVSSARNRGIAEARGEYIAFLDADDEWRPDALKTFYDFLSSHDCQWAVSGYARRYKGREKDLIFSKTRIVADALEALAAGMSIWTGAIVVKRSCFAPDMLFDTKVARSEDREVWLKLACKYPRVGYIGRALAIYNAGLPASLTNTGINKVDFDFLSLEERIAHFATSISEQRKGSLNDYILKFNRKALFSFWINNKNFFNIFPKKHYGKYLTKLEILMLSKLSIAPIFFKKIFIKFFLIEDL